MSVVDGDWDSLKRYNLYELYEQAFKKADSKTTDSKATDSKATDSLDDVKE